MLKSSTLSNIVEAAKKDVSPFEFGNLDIKLVGFSSLQKYNKFKKLSICNDRISLLDSNGVIFMGTLNASEISIFRELKSNEVLGPVTALNFSRNGKLFAIGYNSGAIKVFNTDKGSLHFQCSPVLNRRGILDLQFTDDSVFVLDNSGTVCSFPKKEYSTKLRKSHHDGSLGAAFSLNSLSKIAAWATSTTLYITGDQYFGEIQVPLAHSNTDTISLPFISIIEYDNNAVVYTAVNKFLTLTKISTLNEVISLQAQGSIDFENELINVKCLESVQFHSDQVAVVLVLDQLEKIYLVCGDIILWFTDIGALRIVYDLHYFENIASEDSTRLKSRGRLALSTHSLFTSNKILFILGDNNIIHSLRVPNIFHFIQTINTRLPKVLSLEYALYSGSRIQLVENTVVDLMHAAIHEVYNHALQESRSNGTLRNGNNYSSHFSSMEPVIRKCVDLCLSTTWNSNRSSERRQQLINEIFYATPSQTRNMFFKALEESASKIEFSWISPELCNLFLEYLEDVKNFELLENVICSMPFETLNLDRTIRVCKQHYLWEGLTHICDAMGDSDTVLSSMINAIEQGNASTKEALFEYLGNSLGFTGEVYEDGVVKTLAWLCEKIIVEENVQYPNIEFLVNLDIVGFCQVLHVTASNSQVKAENYEKFFKILLHLIQHENFKDKGPFVIEMICAVFERRKHFPDIFVNDIINRIVKVFPEETVNLCMSHAWILNHVPLRYELIMSILQKYKTDSCFTPFLTNDFVKRVFDETLSQFSENPLKADEILSRLFNCYDPKNIVVGMIAAESDYCLNKASVYDLQETYIHLSFGRKLPEQGFSAERLNAFLFYLDMFNDLTIQNEWILKLLQVFLKRLENESQKDLINSISLIYTTSLLMDSPQEHLQKALELCYENENFPRRDFSLLLNKTLTIFATRLTDHSELLRLIELEGIVHLLKSVDSATKGYSKEIVPGRCTICSHPITESFMIVQDKAGVTHSECFKKLNS
uniref:Vacuolar protein sorting-associated protein 8 central domain-containing protein n=1 Tax=Panagrolaimus sp. ES5 TaxID=591445 RepID=A0AC34GRG9_9BILA